MNRDEANELMADYLGGELSPADRLRFEAYLNTDPELAGEVAGLERTLATLQQLDAPGNVAQPRTEANHTGAPRWWIAAALRYAAAVAIAFLAGYSLRGPAAESPVSSPTRLVRNDAPDSRSTYWHRVAVAYSRRANGSGLGRSLVALAESIR